MQAQEKLMELPSNLHSKHVPVLLALCTVLSSLYKSHKTAGYQRFSPSLTDWIYLSKTSIHAKQKR
jgi:hypothetical protein